MTPLSKGQAPLEERAIAEARLWLVAHGRPVDEVYRLPGKQIARLTITQLIMARLAFTDLWGAVLCAVGLHRVSPAHPHYCDRCGRHYGLRKR